MARKLYDERDALTVACPSCGAPAGEPRTGSWACVSRDVAAEGE